MSAGPSFGEQKSGRRRCDKGFNRQVLTMAARTYWQGQIRLALVSISVEIYPATKSGSAISFRQIHEPTGKRVNYEKVVAGVGPVDREEILKGYEIAKGNYVLLEDEEIEAVTGGRGGGGSDCFAFCKTIAGSNGSGSPAIQSANVAPPSNAISASCAALPVACCTDAASRAYRATSCSNALARLPSGACRAHCSQASARWLISRRVSEMAAIGCVTAGQRLDRLLDNRPESPEMHGCA